MPEHTRPGLVEGEQFVYLNNPIPYAGFPRNLLEPSEPEHLKRVINRLADSEVLNRALESEQATADFIDGLCQFTPADLEAGYRAKLLAQVPSPPTSSSANQHTWLIVTSPDCVDDIVHAVPGLQAALICVLRSALSYMSVPRRIDVSERRIRIEFDPDDFWAAWVELRLAQPSSPPHFPEQPRYASLLSGLAGTAAPNSVFVQRLSSLPGWGVTTLHSSEQAKPGPGHLPNPKEWRRLSAQIIQRAGIASASSAQVEELVCAVLDFPTWNHLSAAYKAAATGPHGLMVYRTCYRCDNVESFEQTHGSFESALHRLVSAVQNTCRFALGWENLQISTLPLLSEGITISAPSSPDEGEWELTWAFFVSPNEASAALQEWVRRYFDGRPLDAHTIEEMFMARMPAAQRSVIADSLIDMHPLAESGTRRLYREPSYPTDTGLRLSVHALTTDGARRPGFAESFDVAKACLLKEPASRGLVLASENSQGEFKAILVFPERAHELTSAIQAHINPQVQSHGERYLEAMTLKQRRAWRKRVEEL